MNRPCLRRAVSFRDPAGHVFVANGRILRWVSHAHRAEFEAFVASSVVRRHVQSGQIGSYHLISRSEASELAETHKLTGSGTLAPGDLLIEHEAVPFPSFPYEWPPEMIEAAARLTLNLAEELLDDGLGLKDATPYNVLFRGPEPVFVDVLSVVRRDPHDPLWLPYAQFVRTFLLPLTLNRRLGIPLDSLLLGRRDGIEPEEAYRICGPLAKLRPPMLTLATLPTWLGSVSQTANLYSKRRVHSAEQARFILCRIFAGLRRQLGRLQISGKRRSRWCSYVDAGESYSPGQLEQKKQFVDQVLRAYRPRRILDVGCNTGQFSLQAARAGSSVVAIDSDPDVVGCLWRQARDERQDILPLAVNFARPSPATGWRNTECPSFLDRALGKFDLIFVLALLHHLLVSEQIPLAEIINLVAELTSDLAVIEYVGPSDPMFQRLLRGRQGLYEHLSKDAFESCIRMRFHILQSQELMGSDRNLYLLKKFPAQNTTATNHISQKGAEA